MTDLPCTDGRPQEPDDYLLYPVDKLAAGKGSEGQLVRRSVAAPKDRPSAQSVHRWWYRLAADAGLVGPGVTSGLNMHQARHTFAMELRRVAGIDAAASHALGHADLTTTLGIYGHYYFRHRTHVRDGVLRDVDRGPGASGCSSRRPRVIWLARAV